MFKKFLSVLLCFSLVFGMTVLPAYAGGGMGGDDLLFDEDEVNEIIDKGDQMLRSQDEMLREIFNHTNNLNFRAEMLDEAQKAAAESWAATANNIFSVVRNISTVIGLINGVVSLLKLFGVIKDRSGDIQISILEGIKSLQNYVESIDKKADRIQETLIDEFSAVDIQFARQEYNHYKDDVWASFFTDAVTPLTALQNEFNDEVNWLNITRAEQWLDTDGSDMRVLYGSNENGEKIQVFSGLNLAAAGEELPRQPRLSLDSHTVESAIVLPGEYICGNMDEYAALTADNCLELLFNAFTAGVFEAAENGELIAPDAFYTEWNALNAAEKYDRADELASDLVDAAAFASVYDAANEYKFASSVRSAYSYFCKWLNGSDSLTSPLLAQLQMLALTHAFEGEITQEANAVYLYLDWLNINFGSFAKTVLSLSKSHTEANCLEVTASFIKSEYMLNQTFNSFITGNPNYCYTIGAPIRYKNAAVESSVSLIRCGNRDRKVENVSKWVLRDDSVLYSDDAETRTEQILRNEAVLKDNMLSSRELKTIYLTFVTLKKQGLTDCASFTEYLTANRVISPTSAAGAYPSGVNPTILTSVETESLDMNLGALMNYWMIPVVPETEEIRAYYDDLFHMEPEYINKNKQFPGWYPYYDDIRLADKATGGTFSLATGEADENRYLAGRVVNLALGSTMNVMPTGIFAYGDEFVPTNTKVSSGTVVDMDFRTAKHYGVITATAAGEYEFPVGTTSVGNDYFGSYADYSAIIFNAAPEYIADNAFGYVGSEDDRCLLVLPEDYDAGSIGDTWHGGYFGTKLVTFYHNDGTDGYTEKAMAPDTLLSTVPCPLQEKDHPANKTFAGWGISPDSTITVGENASAMRSSYYAVWTADHAHTFRTENKAPTCTESGYSGRRICTICGYVETEGAVLPAEGHAFILTAGTQTCSRCGRTVNYTEADCGVLTVLTDTPDGVSGTVSDGTTILTIDKDGEYIVGNTTPDLRADARIIVDAKNVRLTLNGVYLRPAAGPVIEIAEIEGADNTVATAKGTENDIASRTGCAIQKGVKGTLRLAGEGSLTALSAFGAAAIGSPNGENTSGIIIESGSISISGKGTGAGIGAGASGRAGLIVINGGSIDVATGKGACAIGAGMDGSIETILINGGQLVVEGNGAPAIGAPTPLLLGGLVPEIRLNGGEISANVWGTCPGTIGFYSESDGIGIFYTNGVYITPDASLKTDDTSKVTYRNNGTALALNVIDNPGGKTVFVDGKECAVSSHIGEAKVYLYLPAGTHETALANRIFTDPYTEHGTFTVTPAFGKAGDEITVEAVPDTGWHLDTVSVSPDTPVSSGSFTMPDADVEVSVTFALNTHTVSWIADGVTTEESFTFGQELTAPAAPEKEGYRFAGWTPVPETVMPDCDLTYTAEFTPVTYYAKFTADGKTVQRLSYTVESSIEAPDVPAKEGYTGAWEDYELTPGGITVNAVYTPDTYTVTWIGPNGSTTENVTFGEAIVVPAVTPGAGYRFTGWDKEIPAVMPAHDLIFTALCDKETYRAVFTADGKTVDILNYDAETPMLKTPDVPAKEGYKGAWEDYELTPGGITVNAVYTPVQYTAKFMADGRIIARIPYTVETAGIDAPDVPAKAGYTSRWCDYDLEIGGVTVYAIYTPAVYTVTWNIDGMRISVRYGCGEPIIAPEVPEIEGRAFTGWSPALLPVMPAGDMEFTAQYRDLFVDAEKDGTVINTAGMTTVNYKNNVIIIATAQGVPAGCHLALYVNDVKVKDGTATKVTYDHGIITEDIFYTVKVIDKAGNVQISQSGYELVKEGGKISCKADFIRKLFAFIKTIFNIRTEKIVEP